MNSLAPSPFTLCYTFVNSCLFIYFLSVILSGVCFVIFFLLLSPGCSLPLSLSPSLCLCLSFSFFLLLSLCLLPHTHPLTLSLSSPLPLSLQCLFLSPSACNSPPPLRLISPSFSLYLSFSLFSFILSSSPPLDSCLV